ncbi:unnamed protein product [Blepharisma stoltei]|uniref:Uncharacterized protein n=1 Tax=Blepharisma stoltei TaxID=1481888 RepID=A0AAU9J8Q6_9CILI|nr:unnamed protein product [Blepharisma stoltei]
MEISPAHKRSSSVKRTTQRRANTALNKTSISSTTERKIKLFMNNHESGQLLDVSYSIPKVRCFLPSQEKVEASARLILLRKRLDKSKQSFLKEDKVLSVMRRELNNLAELKIKKQSSVEETLKNSEKLESRIEWTKKQQDEEEKNRQIYLHIIDRMKSALFHLEKKSLNFKATLQSQNSVLKLEFDKSLKSKEAKLQSRFALTKFQSNLNYESQERLNAINNAEKDLKNRELSIIKKEENKKRQEEYLEKAIIDDQCAHSVGLREKYLIHKMWFNLMTFQFQKEHEKWKILEEAFIKMKISTGLKDIETMVERFLTKEQSYQELLVSVKQKETECTGYKQKIEGLQVKIDILNKEESEPKSKTNEEEKKRNEILKAKKRVEELEAKRLKLYKTTNKIKIWAEKMASGIHKSARSGVFLTENENSEEIVVSNEFIENLRKIRNDVRQALQGVYSHKEKIPEFLSEVKRESMAIIINKAPEVGKSIKITPEEEIELKDLVGLDESLVLEETLKKSRRSSAKSQINKP